MTYHIGKWNEILPLNDAEKIWSELHRIVSKNKLARIQAKRDGLYSQGKFDYFTDLTQELFTVLLTKNRFNYYTQNQMSDVEIEIEISQIELMNMLKRDIRKKQPESFRMARRVSNILKTSPLFVEQETSSKAMADKQFILSDWPEGQMETANWETIVDKMSEVPYAARDIRMAGCAGDSQIIISNAELENLMVTLFYKVSRAMTVKQVRDAVISRLPIMDVRTIYVEEQNVDPDKPEFELKDDRDNPEEIYVHTESYKGVKREVDSLISNIKTAVHNKDKQFITAMKILYHFYLTPGNSQLDVSRIIGTSDALVSGYRKTIEGLLSRVSLITLNEGLQFHKLLMAEVKKIISE